MGKIRSLVWTCTLALNALLPGCHEGDFRPVTPEDTSRATTSLESGATYKLGMPIEFRSGGNSEPFRVGGWSGTQIDHTWTEGSAASLKFEGINQRGPLLFKMIIFGAVNGEIVPSQPVAVYANGQKVADWNVAALDHFTATIPAALNVAGRTLNIELRIPRAFSPLQSGSGTDPRLLGLCAYSAQIDQAPE